MTEYKKMSAIEVLSEMCKGKKMQKDYWDKRYRYIKLLTELGETPVIIDDCGEPQPLSIVTPGLWREYVEEIPDKVLVWAMGDCLMPLLSFFDSKNNGIFYNSGNRGLRCYTDYKIVSYAEYAAFQQEIKNYIEAMRARLEE